MKKIVLVLFLFTSSLLANGNIGYKLYKKGYIKEAITKLSVNAHNGDLNSIYNLGLIYGNLKNYGESIKYLTRAAWMGYSAAQSKLALIYHYGIGVPQNNVKAFFWLKKAAKQNIVSAQYIVGRMYIYGDHPVSRDYQKAAFWIDKAKDKNYKDSYYIWSIYKLSKYL